MTATTQVNRITSKYYSTPGLDTPAFRALLNSLSHKELKILIKYDDLVERVVEICKYTKEQLVKELKDQYFLDTTDCKNDDAYVSLDEDICGNLIPKWLKEAWGNELPHHGWFLSFGPGLNEFVPWARSLMLIEVRINLNIRYLEYKQEKLDQRDRDAEVNAIIIHQLGGNYI